MYTIKRCAILTVFISLISLCGCSAGREFVKPNSDSLLIGKTTYNEIIERFGKPSQEGTSMINDLSIKSILYTYATSGGEALYEGVTPARSMVFQFSDNVLIGHIFNSSFKADNTEFDESKLSLIKKGETTKNNVIKIMGTPSIINVVPYRGKLVTTFGYIYSHVKGSAFNLKQYQKTASITIDDKEIVSDVQLTITGQK
jgi:outer membrane protein assembly factor BamE (lipoprotein component of BamABCDE complex)